MIHASDTVTTINRQTYLFFDCFAVVGGLMFILKCLVGACVERTAHMDMMVFLVSRLYTWYEPTEFSDHITS